MTGESAENGPPQEGAAPPRSAPIREWIQHRSLAAPDRAALLAQGRDPLSYRALFDLIESTARTLRRLGLRRDDRVAVVLPTGPEMAAAVAAIAAGAVCVPLNPRIATGDWHQYFRQLRVKALLTMPDSQDARQAAGALDLQTIDLHPLTDGGAGAFELAGPGEAAEAAASAFPELDDDAFVLPTSGTVSWPKTVPLTHRNLCHSAANTMAALALSDTDRLLSVLPLHHAHGLIAGLMSALAAGASVVGMRQFEAGGFFAHLSEFEPTWYTAVPTIHQAVVSEAGRHPHILQDHSLRLIRSASASLPKQVIADLERLFAVPVIETYGMTEAASQIASNPLPPGTRKPGSVGVAAGPEIAIVDSAGRPVAAGEQGEIALRGPNLTRGYEDQADTDGAFADGWFRTGDLGYMDGDGYVFIVGRCKEIINRGGEKIAPSKVEDVLAEHPEVAQAAVFPIPHPRLGEDVAAAVVLHPEACATERDLQAFAIDSGKLTQSAVPRRIAVVERIPKTETGKIRRNSLAQALGLGDGKAGGAVALTADAAPASDVERRLSRIWADVLGLEDVGLHDDFFLLGGESLLATQILARVLEAFHVSLPLRAMFDAPTVAELAAKIAASGATDAAAPVRLADDTHDAPQPVSISQDFMLEAESGLPGLPIYNIPFAFRLAGELNAPALERAVNIVVARHEILRTVFRHREGGSVQQVLPPDAARVAVEPEDWSVVGEAHRTDFAKSLAEEASWAIFDLSRTPPLRIRLLKLATHDHVLLLTLHHIIMDGWSVEVFMKELAESYADCAAGGTPTLASPGLQFCDFARWQRRWCEGAEARAQLAYWSDRLREPRPAGPDEQASYAVSLGFSTARAPVRLSCDLMQRLASLSRRENSSVFMVLLTGLKTILLSQLGDGSIGVATPMANRSRRNTHAIIGPIENTAIIRANLNGATSFREALASVREAVLEAHAHQEIPFQMVARTLADSATAEGAAPFQAYFAFSSLLRMAPNLAGITAQPFGAVHEHGQPVLPVNRASFMLMLNETCDGAAGSLIYREKLLSFESADQFVTDYGHLLARAASAPERPLARLLERD